MGRKAGVKNKPKVLTALKTEKPEEIISSSQVNESQFLFDESNKPIIANDKNEIETDEFPKKLSKKDRIEIEKRERINNISETDINGYGAIAQTIFGIVSSR